MMKTFPAHVLILGGGITGLSAALRFAQKSSVTLLTKAELEEGNTRYAQGGISAVWDHNDDFQKHIDDTLTAGAGLCAPDIVKLCVERGPALVKELIELGVPFDKSPKNPEEYSLHQEGGHTARRILHVKDYTGASIEQTLAARVRENPNIQILEFHMGIDLIMEGKISKPSEHASDLGAALGAYVLNTKTGKIIPMRADLTILATGGAGKVYLYTSNPDLATGDGIAMAYRAKARIANMEFMQFHPTCLYHPSAKNALITEAIRGEGAILRNIKGQAFMERYHPFRELAPRDIVARAIDAEMKRFGDAHVWLDVSHMKESEFQEKFPQVLSLCRRFGIHPPQDWIPVVPAAHYLCGGIEIDSYGFTSIPRLAAIGEVAHSGLHGANRLASNSLLEGLVFAERIFEGIKQQGLPQLHSQEAVNLPEWDFGRSVDLEEQIDIAATWREIRTLMWNYVGIVRSDRRLIRARERLSLIRHEIQADYWKFKANQDLIELRNLLTVAELIVECALRRKESRGLHFNSDYPKTTESERHDTVI